MTGREVRFPSGKTLLFNDVAAVQLRTIVRKYKAQRTEREVQYWQVFLTTRSIDTEAEALIASIRERLDEHIEEKSRSWSSEELEEQAVWLRRCLENFLVGKIDA